ncbi:hypothetical protein [Paenibacillus sp. FSL R5-0908]|uniref:Uncharacterized protein n=2 Tax=Paenibacillus TaxID=44249 RepID=A0AB36J3K1_9BACL|nr:hypothetical protein BJP50_28865 [Paenibacillus odorifer]OME07077.1 hypothetical protein BSK60_31915 [Paenibacillus odorifer]OME11101.1 hypothetical protein BSK47_29790 [Paenibacillus odorifer]
MGLKTINYIWSAVISSFTAIAVVFLTTKANERISKKRLEEERKERYVLRLLSVREESYNKIYRSLIDLQNYLAPFINPGNEFLEYKDMDEFAPLSQFEQLSAIARTQEIWLHKESNIKINQLLTYLNQLNHEALEIAVTKMIESEGEKIDNGIDIQESAKLYIGEALSNIEELKDHIRKVSGGESLDKYVDGVTSWTK